MRGLITFLAVAVVMWVPAKLPAQGKGGDLAERLQDLHLTDDQEAKIAEIRSDYKAKVIAAGKALKSLIKEEVEKVRDVLTPQQKATLADLKEEAKDKFKKHLAERIAHFEELDLTDGEIARIAEIRKDFRPKIEKALDGLKGVLNSEQMQARLDGLKAGKKGKEILASFKLTDDQKQKVMAVAKDLRGLVREELEKIRDLMSEGQKEKLVDLAQEAKEKVRDKMCHMISTLKSLKLTDEQKSQIAAIRKEYRPKIQEAGNALRGMIREELQSVIAVLKG